MRKYFIFLIGSFIIMLSGLYCVLANPREEDSRVGHHQEPVAQKFELSGKVENGIRVIEVKASRYKFVPDPIVVKLGEKVRLVLSSSDVTHGLTIPEFNVNIIAAPSKAKAIEFIVDKKGNFNAYCSVYCGPGHARMHASFIVE